MGFGIGTKIEKEMLETRYFDLLSELPATGEPSLINEIEKWLELYNQYKTLERSGNAITCNLKIQKIHDVMRKKGFEPEDYDVYKRQKFALDRKGADERYLPY